MFEIDKACAVILLSEAGDFPRPMLANTAFKIIGYPDIEGRSGFIAHHVNPVTVICRLDDRSFDCAALRSG